jgi:hypothetical protein
MSSMPVSVSEHLLLNTAEPLMVHEKLNGDAYVIYTLLGSRVAY